MFKINSNTDRLNYGDMLMPPAGYVLESAVGTTYSLDLEALTAVAISLELSEETDSDLLNNPISMFNALQKVSDRIVVFCEAGQIKLPQTPGALFLILEKMVCPVALKPYDSSARRYPAFHPKMWLMTYVNAAGEKQYRFVVLSRNLTFDRSWDVSFAMDGQRSEQGTENTGPILDLLQFLKAQIGRAYTAGAEKKKLLERISEDLQGVAFRLDSRQFTDFQILPLGIGENGYDIQSDALWRDTFHEILIMSPFLTGSVIAHFNDDKMGLTNVKRTLITRKSELANISGGKADGFDIYVLKDRIYDGEDELSEEAGSPGGIVEEARKQDIHAKIFLRKKYSDVDMYLGSMNATYSAMNKNVELLVRLRTKNRHMNTDIFLKDIFGGDADAKDNPFERADGLAPESDESEDVLRALEYRIKKLCRSKGRAAVEKQDDNKYRIRVRFSIKDKTVKDIKMENMTISPLRCPYGLPVEEQLLFENLDVLQLSEFYTVSVTEGEYSVSRVIMIPTANLPGERDKAVVQSVVKDKKSFIEYVAFVLGDDYILSALESKSIYRSGAGAGYGPEPAMPAVYEKMLKTALEEPAKLKEIRYILKMIEDRGIIPDEFREMYETFCRTLRL